MTSNAMLILFEQAIAANFKDTKATAIFRRQIEYGLSGQAQGSLKKRKRIQQPFTTAGGALTYDMGMQCIAPSRAHSDGMKQFFAVAQRQPCFVSIANVNRGRSTADHRRRVRAPKLLAGLDKLERARGRAQLALVIDQVPA